MKQIRALRPDEIEVRVGGIPTGKDGGVAGLRLLLFKEAKTDMNVLDETFGAMMWKREHVLVGNYLTCIVSVKDPETGAWVSKQDVGSSDNRTETEKSAFSDSFKRACVSWGIGRELYSAPPIWIKPEDFDVVTRNNKFDCNDKFKVSKIESKDGKITALEIFSLKKNRVVFSWEEQR